MATETYKVANDLSLGDFKNLFDFKGQYTLHIPLVDTELKGKDSIRYFGAVIWNAILVNIKTATSLNGFRIELNLGNQSAHADSVKPFYRGVGFINIT